MIMVSVASRMTLPMAMLVLSFLATLVVSQSTPILTPKIPLLVRSPYFNAWLSARNGSSPAGVWPEHWSQHVIGWSGAVRVDGTAYLWMGSYAGVQKANTTAMYITPTRSIFTIQAESIAFNATFLSPVEPSDLVRQSLPFAYLYIDAWSLDGQPHSVQFYSDTTGEWLSSTTDSTVEWNTTQLDTVVYHQMRRTGLFAMIENKDMAEDGTLYYGMEKRSGMSWQTGSADTTDGLRARFLSGNPLSNIGATDFRAIKKDWPVLGMRVDLGDITKTESSVVWAIGMIREPVIRFTKSGSIESRSSYFWTKYNSIDNIIRDVIADFPAARTRAIDFDGKVTTAGEEVSAQYSDLLSVSLKQALGSMDITVSRLPDGSVNASDVRIFMKDVGISGRVNPVETIYATLPAILYVNASLAGPLLEPLLQYQSTSDYKNVYAAPDLGTSYPDVKGNSSDTQLLAIESCSNMLIMTLAHATKSGDGSLLLRYYDQLKEWADYLDKNTLYPSGYANADGQSYPNLSNLALKGIIGLFAMSKINAALETTGKLASVTSHYQMQAASYAKEWESKAISSGHVTSIYGDMSSWGLVYNLYAARLLESDVFSDQTYTKQAEFYSSQAASAPRFGLAYDTNDKDKVKSHWTMLTAATVTDSTTRDMLVSMVHERAFFNRSSTPFPTTYNAITGETYDLGGTASPAQGAVFSFLALKIPNQSISNFAGAFSVSNSKTTNVGTIVGGVVGGVCLIILLGLIAFFLRRRRRQQIVNDGPQMISTKTGAKRNSAPVLDDGEGIIVEPFLAYTHNGDSSTILPSPSQYTPTPSIKDRQGYGFSTHLAPYGNTSVSGGSVFSAPGSSASGSNSSSQPSTDIRNEVEQLRREMAEIRAQQIQEFEPPPLYDFATEAPPSSVSPSASTSASTNAAAAGPSDPTVAGGEDGQLHQGVASTNASTTSFPRDRKQRPLMVV